MLFDDNDFDINMAFFMPDIKLKRDKRILNPEEGFLRGNMFKDEYLPYKNLTYFKLNPTNEKERDLYRVMALSFAVNDLNLYLDLHPSNEEVFKKYKEYVDEYKSMCKEFEQKYGPLKLTESTGSKYTWLDSPWPWDSMGGSKYV